MKLTGNTVLITGGSSGIGRGLAEALHRRGNKVIISGRRKGALDAVAQANPGIESVVLDVKNTSSVTESTKKLLAAYPELNVLINNSGIQILEDLSGKVDEADMLSQVETNIFGTVRMTNALVEHLKTRDPATIVNVSSILAFAPWAMPSIYSATKAFIHSYTLSLRYKLKDTSVKVLDLIPPWVHTELMGDIDQPAAMPLSTFIDETLVELGTDSDELIVKRARRMRNNAGPDEQPYINQWNDLMCNPPDAMFVQKFNDLVE